jgi:hypothetical protein
VQVIKSRRQFWAWAFSSDGEGRGVTGFWWGNLREKIHWGDPGIDRRIILKWILKK